MLNKIKGTRDLSPKETAIFELVRNVFLQVVKNFNFNLVESPIIEPAQLYKRTTPDSDIVKKEMYEFIDKGQREIALRPEGTAGFVRAAIENKWYAELKTPKFAYYGPMFRYEQPQKGRYRQFYQAGVEYLGNSNPYIDAELIIMASQILKILDVNYVLKINSIGNSEARNKYYQVLREYFTKYQDQLSEISKERIKGNVLRILDDKEESKKDFVIKAPKINKFLSNESNQYFEKILTLLDEANIKYQVDYSIVRGLDYYDEVVYEFVSTSKAVGSQSTLIGGGRYSHLFKELGGPEIASSGWGFGIDRISEIIEAENIELKNDDVEKINILVAATDEANLSKLFMLANELRNYNIKLEFLKEVTKSKKLFEKANKLNADFVIFNDPFIDQKLLVVKSLKNNEKLNFMYSEDGFLDLLEFLSDNGLKELEEIELEEND